MGILVCYDGSADAKAAIDRAGELLPGSEATILVIWETLLETMSRNGAVGMGFGMILPDGDDAAIEKAAHHTAQEGVAQAMAAGLKAESRIAVRHGEIAMDILEAADSLKSDVIVLGTRGRGEVKSLLLGSVSDAVLHHADRPVLVIPSQDLAHERRSRSEHARLSAGLT
jgi:nucleotide-binding universal stress UspA family protein